MVLEKILSTVRNFSLAAALGLGMYGCSECTSYNDTTEFIYPNAEYGPVLSFEETSRAEEAGNLNPIKSLIKRVTELSSGGMPGDGIAITRVPDECLKDIEAEAYTTHDNINTNPGVYIPQEKTVQETSYAGGTLSYEAEFEIASQLETIFHEIGHLQTGGESAENISQLNSIESSILAAGVLAHYGKLDGSFLRRYNAIGEHIEMLMSKIYSGEGDNEHLGPYELANIFVVSETWKGRTFSEIRTDLIARDGQLENTAVIQEIADSYNSLPRLEKITFSAEKELGFRYFAINEIKRTLGEEAAREYATWLSTTFMIDFTLGKIPDGTNCLNFFSIDQYSNTCCQETDENLKAGDILRIRAKEAEEGEMDWQGKEIRPVEIVSKVSVPNFAACFEEILRK